MNRFAGKSVLLGTRLAEHRLYRQAGYLIFWQMRPVFEQGMLAGFEGWKSLS